MRRKRLSKSQTIEDRIDLREARKAARYVRKHGAKPWEELKTELMLEEKTIASRPGSGYNDHN